MNQTVTASKVEKPKKGVIAGPGPGPGVDVPAKATRIARKPDRSQVSNIIHALGCIVVGGTPNDKQLSTLADLRSQYQLMYWRMK